MNRVVKHTYDIAAIFSFMGVPNNKKITPVVGAVLLMILYQNQHIISQMHGKSLRIMMIKKSGNSFLPYCSIFCFELLCDFQQIQYDINSYLVLFYNDKILEFSVIIFPLRLWWNSLNNIPVFNYLSVF